MSEKSSTFAPQNDFLHLMKKWILLVALWVATLNAAFAATTLDADLKAALPSKDIYLPGPPEVGSPIWLDDSIKYFHYKEIGNRFDAEKGECWDSAWANMNEQYYFALYRVTADSVMNAPFIDVTWTRTNTGKYTVTKTHNTTDYPEINKLWELCVAMKEANTESRERPRPYKYFGYWYKGKNLILTVMMLLPILPATAISQDSSKGVCCISTR